MKTIEFTSNYGNFDYRLTANIGDDVNAASTALCKQGLANIAYRTVGSYVDKALGVKAKSKGGDGRTAVLYSEADGEVINRAVSTKLAEIENEDNGALKPLGMSFAVTGQHEFGAGSDTPTKEATELWTTVQQKTGEAFEKALKVLGLDESYTDESGVLACKRFLQEAKRRAKEQAAAALGA